MGKFTKSIEIEASPEEVFTFINDDKKMNEANKDVKVETASEGPVGVGTRMHYVTGSGGSTMEFDSEVVEFVRNEKFVSYTIGASKFKGTASFTLEPATKGTKLSYSMDYEMPYSLLGRLVDKVRVRKVIEKT